MSVTTPSSSPPPPALSGLALAQPGAAGRPRLAFWRRLLLSDYFVLYLTVFLFVSAAIIFPRIGLAGTLGLPTNISNQFLNMWPLLAVALGQTFVLIIGGIDLSQGSVMAITSVIGAMVMSTTLDPAMFDKSPVWGSILTAEGGLLRASPELAVPLGVLAMLLVGAGIGFLNGFAITKFRIAPFMVTLVTMTFFSAFALWLTQSRNISGLPEEFLRLGTGDIISVYLGPKLEAQIARRDILPAIAYPTVIALGLALLAQVLLKNTVFGRQMFAIGTNRRAAQISGVPADRVVILVYMFSGFCAAVSSILYSARLGIGQPSLGNNLMLDIIGAAVIGGTSLFGGKGSIKGTLFGVAFFVLLLNMLNAARLSPFIIDAVKGGVILLAAFLDVARARLTSREQHA
ncbi:MAG: ABC transporter permease [Anaerolineae bacterium]|jgi:ribose/xylose/arabinose/galactoside ABC-type transport system permease subunit|nr:ABC transporter permease [Anaerolineae bacterium]